MFSPFCPITLRFASAENAAATIQDAVPHNKAVLLLGDAALKGQLASFCSSLADAFPSVRTLWISAPPNVEALFALLQSAAQDNIGAIVCIGGGSTIDMGKGLRAFWGEDFADADALRRGILQHTYRNQKEKPPLIVMPTTAGTGSEVTPWATIWDPAKNAKLSIDGVGLFPAMSVVVAEWTLSMPAGVTLATGLDALAHAMEAFWARDRNPLCQELSLSAISLIREYLPRVLAAPRAIDLREKMCLAALFAGLSFSMTRTTACHSISYILTMRYQIPHGFAVALTLASVGRKNRAVVPEINRVFSIFDGECGFTDWMRTTCCTVQPLSLSAFGVPEGDLPGIASEAFSNARMQNNPVELTQEDVLSILQEAYL